MTSRRALLGVAVPTLAAAAAGLGTPAQAAVTSRVALPSPDPLARAVRALSTQDFAPAKVVVLGSSTTEGQGASRLDRRFVAVLESLLRRRPGGLFLPAGQTYPAGSNPVRLSGGAVNAYTVPNLSIGWAGRSVALGTGAQVDFDFVGTGVHVVYGRYPGGPVLQITVDGVTTDVPSDGPVNRWLVWQSPALTGGSHTVSVRATGVNAGFVRGFRSFNGDETSGVHVYDGGRGGWQTADYLASESQWGDGIAAIQPDLIVMQLGANDITLGRSPDAIREDLVSVVRKAQSYQAENAASVIIVGSAQTTGKLPTRRFREQFTSMWQQAASQVGGVFLDPSDVLPPPGAIGNLYGPDHIHLTDAGHAALGYLIARMLPMLPRAF